MNVISDVIPNYIIIDCEIKIKEASMAKIRNLFISHSWAYEDAYEKFCNLLNAAPRFEYRNSSVPKNDPIHNAANQQELFEAIKRRPGSDLESGICLKAEG